MLTVAAILLSFDSLRKVGAGLLTGVGIGGIIIGFAAQSSLSNLLAGFQIAFTQPMRIGDVVIAENEWGVIEEITLTYVVMALWDGIREDLFYRSGTLSRSLFKIGPAHHPTYSGQCICIWTTRCP